MTTPPGPWAQYSTPPAPSAGPWTKYGVAPDAGADGSAVAGGSWTPAPIAQTAKTEDVLKSYAPGFVKAHPTIAGLIGGAGDVLQGGGRELIGQGIRLAKLAYPKGGAALQRIAGDYATPMPGTAQSVGRIGTQVGEFMIPGGAEEAAAARIGDALEHAPAIVRGAAKLIPSAVGAGGITALQGGNPYAGAAAGAGGELGAAGLKRAGEGLAESAAGITSKMRKFGRTYGRMILDETKGFRPATVANSAEDAIGRIGDERMAMADAASVPQVVSGPAPRRLALPAGPAPERIRVPLHEATATVEKASPLQPAMIGTKSPILARDTGRVLSAPEQTEFHPPEYRNATAMENVGAPTERSAGDAAAVNRQAELAENNGSIFRGPGGTGDVTHPMTHPLNTVQVTEPAQGVWMRTPDGGVVQTAPATRPEELGFTLARPNTISRIPAENAAGDYANTLENRYHENPGGARAVHGQIQRFNEEMSPREAVDLSRALARHIDFGKMPGVGHPDNAAAALAGRYANELQLEGLLGRRFGELGNHESALIALKNAMLRRSLGPGFEQRIMERGAARTGALASAILGAEAAGPAGAIAAPFLQELSASPASRMALARFADRPAAAASRIAAPALTSAFTQR